jgi:SAM-dependent methyltransferase
MNLIDFINKPFEVVTSTNKPIHKFNTDNIENIDRSVVESFGNEWEKFYNFSDEDINQIGNEYFGFLSENVINSNTYMLDVGCGTGRWSKYMSSRVKFIEAIDPSKAIFFADKLLNNVKNVRLSMAASDCLPFSNDSFDFVMSVGVLHHIPDTQKAIIDCVKKVKPGGYFYVYLYYAFDNKGLLFKSIFKISDLVRKVVSKLPHKIKIFTCDILAYLLYVPLVYIGKFFKFIGLKSIAKKIPLSDYQNKSIFIIRNDSLDRFGTSLEQRFTKVQIIEMLSKAGLVDIIIPDGPIHWSALGKKPV